MTTELLADSGALADRRPTAIFAVTDQLALGVLDGAASSGVRVPEGLSVVGFDNVKAAASATPPLTTVGQDLFEQGKAAAKVALDLVAGRPARSQNFDTQLIVRGSTAPPSEGR
jgi:LacI family transcriptional regulator